MSRRRSLGCNEIIFNPLVKWWRDGPISRQLRGFVWSRAPVHYKIGMMACKFDTLSFFPASHRSHFAKICSLIVSTLCYLLLCRRGD